MITCLVNGKVYIGKSSLWPPRRRWARHLTAARHGPDAHRGYQLIHRAINKYGEENFFFEVIAEFENEDEWNQAEIDYIAKYRAREREYGYNIAPGGKGGCLGYKHTPEARRKISEAKKGKTGPLAPLYGKHHTAETRRLLSDLARQRLKDPANRVYGWRHSEETRARMRRNCHRRKPTLSHDRVNEIRRQYATGECTLRQLSERLGLNIWVMKRAIRGKDTYRNLGDHLPRDEHGRVKRPARPKKNMKALSPEEVAELRRQYREGASCEDLARERGVGRSLIGNAVFGRAWYGTISCDEPPAQHISKALHADQIEHVRALYASGKRTQEQLASEFGTSKRAIRCAILGLGRYGRVGTPLARALTKAERAELLRAK